MNEEPDWKKQRALDFAKRLINRRSDLGMSQSDLASRAGDYLPEKRSFSRASISRYEAGENIPGPSTLSALAKALNTEPDELLPRRRIAAAPRAPLSLEVDEDGMVKLSVDTKVSFDVARQIMALLPNKT